MFLLDSNIFISAARLYYHPDVAPTFWEWLAEEHQKGNLASIEAVRREINDRDGKNGHGFLQEWASQLPTSFWISPDSSTISSMKQLSIWATHKDRQYAQAAQDEFFRIADYYLVAQAHSASPLCCHIGTSCT
jgi:hypothetical protein